MSDYQRLLEASLRELERVVVHQVESEFEALPDNDSELPWIGGEPFCYCERATQKNVVIAALLARKWFESEAPRWAQPLPLKFEDCIALFNGPHRGNFRSRMVGEYGIVLRSMRWNLQRIPKFEVFCSQMLSPPS